MIDPYEVLVLPIAKSMPEPYNYLTNPIFCGVHYYNGNSFRISPFQHTRGSICASGRRLKRNWAWTGLHKAGLGEDSTLRKPDGPTRGNWFRNSPGELVKTGSMAVKEKAHAGEPLVPGL